MLIFLDIDGVLNDRDYRLAGIRRKDYSVLIDPQKVELLRRIVSQTGAAIVLSSSWSKFWEPEPVDSAGRRINEALAACGLEVLAKIPQIRDATRSREIEMFLDMREYVTNFVILDDNDHSWSRRLRSHWVQTDGAVGLSEETVSQAIDVLRGNLRPLPKETLWQKIKAALGKLQGEKL